jgi:asparagine synthase (glutamine-hydrolysing)
MCGIAGAINIRFNAERLNEVLFHRGPDEQSGFVWKNVQLQHLRLSILDKVGGKQPMSYLDRYVIVFNGEIYNHLEVRKELGLTCTTASDTETILHAWHKVGPKMLHFFDGMFAMAIYDKEKEEMFFARDRAGKKPLYYYDGDGRFLFASELNAIRALLPLEINFEHLPVYLRFGSLFRHQTPYRFVKELEAGHCMLISINELKVRSFKWWSIGDFYRKPALKISESDALLQLDEKLQTAVKRRLESSDLEVGSFLSGGIDSGIITAMAASLKSRLRTYTVIFPGGYNEGPLAGLVSRRYETEHSEIEIGFDDLATEIERIIAHYGEPFYDSSAIPSWYVSKAAKKSVTVILNGDGADELFGGYRRYVPFARHNFFTTTSLIRGLARTCLKVLPVANQKKSGYNYLHRLLSLTAKGDDLGTFLSATSDIFEGYESYILDANGGGMETARQYIDQYLNMKLSGLKSLLLLDFDITLFNDFLVKMDIATMAHSLEGRSPMLCREILEWVPSLPDSFKVKGSSTKYLLRRLAAKYLPEELIHQPKRGFEVPLKQWVDGSLRTLIMDYLTSPNALYKGLLKPGFVEAVIEKKQVMPSEKRAKILWTLTCLEIWYRHQQSLYRPASESIFL